MRLFNVRSGRAVYYDRNPADISLGFSGTDVVPHAETQRASYTVPTDKKAFLEQGITDMVRTAAAGTPGQSITFMQHTPDGGSAISYLQARLTPNFNSIGDRDKQLVGTSLLILEADLLEIVTQDLAVTGTVTYATALKLTEFDE